MEIKREDLDDAKQILTRDYIESTDLLSHDLSSAEVVFDENAAQVECPGCRTVFIPSGNSCPECGLTFG